MGIISAILEDCTTSKLAVIGDFNAAVKTTFETELLAMCDGQCLVVSDYEVFGRLSQQFTYVSDAHSTTSWLDHFICSYNLHVIVFDMQLLDMSPSSDYLPVRAKFKLYCTMIDSDGTKDSSNVAMSVMNFQWAKATDVHIDKYNSNTHMILKTIDVPGAIFCKDANCKDDHHNSDIDAYYSSICDALLVASRKHICKV